MCHLRLGRKSGRRFLLTKSNAVCGNVPVLQGLPNRNVLAWQSEQCRTDKSVNLL